MGGDNNNTSGLLYNDNIEIPYTEAAIPLFIRRRMTLSANIWRKNCLTHQRQRNFALTYFKERMIAKMNFHR